MNCPYIFILGRLLALSIAEILAVMEKLEIEYQVKSASRKMLILDIEKEIDCREILGTMGGTIKIIQALSIEYQVLSVKKLDIKEFKKEKYNIFSIVKNEIETEAKNLNNKIIAGYSIYSAGEIEKSGLNQISKFIRNNLIALKKELKKEKIACRIIMPKDYETELSSASIINNKILEKGIDLNFVIIPLSGGARGGFSADLTHPQPPPKRGLKKIEIVLGKTVAVQDIESYSRRDYERPCREAKIGMMPPKLAQIMLNLSQVKKGQLVLDPFCGTGVILQEALLAGCRVIGSDANEKQVQNTKNNLEWLEKNYLFPFQKFPLCKRGLGMADIPLSGGAMGGLLTHPQPLPERGVQISKIDAMHLAKKIEHSSIDAIVTETTLGPIYLKNPSPKEIRNNFKKLEKIYLKFLAQAKKVLKPGGKIVMSVPCYQTKKGGFILMPLVDIFKKTGYSVKEPLPRDILDELESVSSITKRNTLIYSRKNQIVGREIIILE